MSLKVLLVMIGENWIFPKLAKDFWNSCWYKIKESVHVSFDKDILARDIVHENLSASLEINIKRIQNLLQIKKMEMDKKHPVFIFTPGPSLEKNLEVLEERKIDFRKKFVVGVDGATRLLVARDIMPDLVISDLDGLTSREIGKIRKNGARLIVIHAHGDNIEKIQALFKQVQIDDKFVFTTQELPTNLVFNWGGFTDGDRAIFAVLAIEAWKNVYLVSMDLDSDSIGRYSKKIYENLKESDLLLTKNEIKKEKMLIALKILRWINSKSRKRFSIGTVLKEKPFNFIKDHDLNEIQD
ncbi:MAG: 6-hydroxymethylpterin diphosphokinase MptE-like protein [Promethearchaeota archaeon]